MVFHDPNSVSYREGSEYGSPFSDDDLEMTPAVVAALSGGPLSDVLHENTIREGGCVDTRWSDVPSIPIGIPEDIDTTPDENTPPDQEERKERRRTVGQPDPNIEAVFDDESDVDDVVDVPSRTECFVERDEWIGDHAQELADRYWTEAARTIAKARQTARANNVEPPVEFELVFDGIPPRLAVDTTRILLDRFRSLGWDVDRRLDGEDDSLEIQLS